MGNPANDTARERLEASLTRRVPTWRIAQDILDMDIATGETWQQLHELAKAPQWQEELNDDFDRVDPADTQIATFAALFPNIPTTDIDPLDPAALQELVLAGLDELGVEPPAGEALAGLARPRRKAIRKRLRFLRDLENKADRVADVWRLRHAQMQAKSRLAYEIDATACNNLTLAYCAYLAARSNRRSIFLLGSQSRARDTIVEGLEASLVADPETNWAQVALVRPTLDVLSRLDPETRGMFVGWFHSAMADAAEALGHLFESLPERMREEMVMVQGVDSSRWNAYAGALNTMRSAWINALLASDLDSVLDSYCPGKAPRLMASDLVWWYRRMGQDLHEDTRMFSAVPYPWDVVNGHADLTRSEILQAAKALDVAESGWVGPRDPAQAEIPSPEPALVHGIVVSDPQLARTLKRCRVFSGKELRYLDDIPRGIKRKLEPAGRGGVTPTASR